MLWFDVEMIRYTTNFSLITIKLLLWFDVEMIRYTTQQKQNRVNISCGLM